MFKENPWYEGRLRQRGAQGQHRRSLRKRLKEKQQRPKPLTRKQTQAIKHFGKLYFRRPAGPADQLLLRTPARPGNVPSLRSQKKTSRQQFQAEPKQLSGNPVAGLPRSLGMCRNRDVSVIGFLFSQYNQLTNLKRVPIACRLKALGCRARRCSCLRWRWL